MECLKNIAVVLVSPQIPENIGLCARIMKNMDFRELVLVDPPDLTKAFEVAKRARDILKKAKVHASLEEALKPFNFVLASTRRKRKDTAVYDLKGVLTNVLSLAASAKVAVLFGREDFGLSRSDLDRADMVFTIPSSASFPSLNASFAVGIFCYELFSLCRGLYQVPRLDYATKKEVERFYEYLGDVLKDIGYDGRVADTSKDITFSLKRIFSRTGLTGRESKLLSGICLKLKDKLAR